MRRVRRFNCVLCSRGRIRTGKARVSRAHLTALAVATGFSACAVLTNHAWRSLAPARNLMPVASLSAGLEVDPSNAQLKDGLESVTRAQSGGSGGGGLGGLFGPEFMARLAMNPQVNPCMSFVLCRYPLPAAFAQTTTATSCCAEPTAMSHGAPTPEVDDLDCGHAALQNKDRNPLYIYATVTCSAQYLPPRPADARVPEPAGLPGHDPEPQPEPRQHERLPRGSTLPGVHRASPSAPAMLTWSHTGCQVLTAVSSAHHRPHSNLRILAVVAYRSLTGCLTSADRTVGGSWHERQDRRSVQGGTGLQGRGRGGANV